MSQPLSPPRGYNCDLDCRRTISRESISIRAHVAAYIILMVVEDLDLKKLGLGDGAIMINPKI